MNKLQDRFSLMINILKNSKGDPLIPLIQINEMSIRPQLNPPLSPQPQNWWEKSFDWFVALQLIPGGVYGPFYRVNEGDHYWPQIGYPESAFSEVGCFFGIQEPKNLEHYKRLYNPIKIPEKRYIFSIKISNVTRNDACIFIGAVAGGEGFQVNPNSAAVELIKTVLVTDSITPKKMKN